MKHRALDKIPGKTFFVGDIHGHHDELIRQLVQKNFDHKIDRVIATGDIIDKGKHSLRSLKLLRQPWFYSTLGNHEDMLLDEHARGYTQNPWFNELDFDAQENAISLIHAGMPLTYTVTLRDNRRIGIVHGHPPVHEHTVDWDSAQRKSAEELIWKRAKLGTVPKKIKGVDAVVFGHNNVSRITSYFKTLCIDTIAAGELTVLRAEEALDLID